MSKRTNATLWTVQTILALLFLFAGVSKLVMPADALAAQSHLNANFMKLIGVLETLGGLGIILPELTRVLAGLTPLAASGLVGIMTGAVIVTILQMGVLPAIVPLVVGLLAAYVARRRWYLVNSFAR